MFARCLCYRRENVLENVLENSSQKPSNVLEFDVMTLEWTLFMTPVTLPGVIILQRLEQR